VPHLRVEYVCRVHTGERAGIEVSSGRILVVEDDPWVRGACADFLGAQGHTIVAVDDGALALAEITRWRPDLILLDLIMPRAELDGVALLSKLAAGLSTIPILILSGLGDTLAQVISPEIAARLRIVAILPKPISLDTLTSEINRLVGSEGPTEVR
jgi:DNA-binding response OmpR family regulator